MTDKDRVGRVRKALKRQRGILREQRKAVFALYTRGSKERHSLELQQLGVRWLMRDVAQALREDSPGTRG